METVSGNTLSSRQHIINFEGYNWIRMCVTGVDEKEGDSIQLNMDIHDVSDGVTDNWIFFGDSITAGGMTNWLGTGFASYINQIDSNYLPIQECSGIGGITSSEGRENIDRIYEEYPQVIPGPNFYSYFEEHPEQLADGVHPDTDGYDAMRRMWAETMYELVYTADTGRTETVQGDVNADGVFSIADVILLQKWLLTVPNTHLVNWKAADFCDDDKLDVFDLCLMKKALIDSNTTE